MIGIILNDVHTMLLAVNFYTYYIPNDQHGLFTDLLIRLFNRKGLPTRGLSSHTRLWHCCGL